MTVNYTLTPINLSSITVGQPFGSSFSSAPPYKMAAIIQATNPSQYYVSYEMFTISGGTPEPASEVAGDLNGVMEDGYEYTVEKHKFDPGDTETNLPSYVLEVEFFNMTNSSIGDHVVVRATIDPNWVVPANLTGMFTTILDIDGDAQLLPVEPQANSFDISVYAIGEGGVLSPNENPGFRIQAAVPAFWSANYASQNSSHYILEAINEDITTQTNTFWNGPRAVIRCTAGDDADEFSQLLNPPAYEPNATGISNTLQPNGVAPLLFFIIPEDGYYVSRHNFQVEIMSGDYIPYEWNGETYYTNTSWEYGLTPQMTAPVSMFDPFPPNQTGGQNIMGSWIDWWGVNGEGWYNQYPDIPIGYGYTGYSNVELFTNYAPSSITSPAWESNVPYTDYFNMAVNYANTDADVLLVDTIRHWISWIDNPSVFYNPGYNFWSTTTSSLPDNYCPSLYTENEGLDSNNMGRNCVAIYLNKIQNYVPGSNPKNITIMISGSAMLDDGSTCDEFNAEID